MKKCLTSVGLVLLLAAPLAFAGTRVHMDTSSGAIVLELEDEKAPKTVDNFLQYVRAGYYDGTIFHRVIDDFMIQGGGYTKDFQKKATRAPVENEADNGLENTRGTIAMARTGDPHSATAQFFINVKDNDSLNYTAPNPRGWGYTVFGQVVEGMDVVDSIRKAATGPGGPFPENVPQTPVIIEKATIISTSKE
jgi:cyclophilin family peptidyl-prolyl cis-trans isomerase